MTAPRDLRKLLGDEASAEELARLQRVHDLLVSVGPPPELPPLLGAPPVVEAMAHERAEGVAWLPRRRAGSVLALAAALAVALAGAGYLIGKRENSFETARVVRMQGSAAAPRASATILVGNTDSAGNTRLRVRLSGLPTPARRTYYELYLTRKGRITYSCGSLRTHAGTTMVELSIPYSLERYSGWVLTRERLGSAGGPHPILLRTRTI